MSLWLDSSPLKIRGDPPRRRGDMDSLYQHNSFKGRRKELRRNATPQEITLWKYLRRSNLGFKFQRQYSIGPYIADFYCSKKRLVIELDGSQHLDAKEYDKERSDYLRNCEIRVLRFWNSEVKKI